MIFSLLAVLIAVWLGWKQGLREGRRKAERENEEIREKLRKALATGEAGVATIAEKAKEIEGILKKTRGSLAQAQEFYTQARGRNE